MPALVAKFVGGRPDFKAFGAFDETAPIRGTTKLAVGDDLQPDIFLHAHDGADALVLNALERVRVQLAGLKALERLAQLGGAQQAADVIGPERRTAHGPLQPQGKFYSSIGEI